MRHRGGSFEVIKTNPHVKILGSNLAKAFGMTQKINSYYNTGGDELLRARSPDIIQEGRLRNGRKGTLQIASKAKLLERFLVHHDERRRSS